jgi:hypothetical protein
LSFMVSSRPKMDERAERWPVLVLLKNLERSKS